ncbi:hypothetical protein EJB05_26850, partial [Eragrostis curvula]
MEPSDEEEDTEIEPAASEQQQVIAEERETISPSASDPAARVQKILEPVEKSHEMVSQRLVDYGPRRDMGDLKQRCLAFMEMEMSIVVASFKLTPQQLQLREQLRDEFGFGVETWGDEVDPELSYLTWWSARIIDLTAPSRHTLLRRAAMRCFCRRDSTSALWNCMVDAYFVASRLLIARHNLLPVTSNHVGLPPQESGAVGIPLVAVDRPMKKLLRWLVSHEETNRGLRVMWIVGPAGVGKTALAMEIHNRLKWQTSGTPCSFQCNLVARAPQTTHSHELLLQDILSEISDAAKPAPSVDESQANRMELLVRCVSERLKDYRYFICIDDLLEASDWDKIKGAFPDNNLGSRVLITTQDQSIALSYCSHSDVLVHKMEPLNHVDTERLLWKEFAQIRRAPYFASANDPSRLWVLLLYMSMFPYGYMFDKDRLITKCCYEGINRFAGRYYFFSCLVNSNVITWVAANRKMNPDETEAGHWHVNYLYHQFAVFKSAETGFAFTSATLKLAAAPKKQPRRLALHHPDPQLPSLLESLDLSWTRSLAVSGVVSEIPLDKFVDLVLLDLEGWENLTDEVLLQVCTSNMFFLQHLSIRNTRVSKLPPEIKKLCNLEVLDVSNTQISELPLEVYQLVHLRELDLRGTRIRKLPKQIVGLQRSLCVLLLGVEGMINSTKTATRVPHDIRHLRRLEMLTTVDLSEQPASFIIALGDLSLKALAITWSFKQCTDQEYWKALLSSMGKWVGLGSLTIHCGLGCSMEFLGSLSNPPKRLEKFKVTAGRFAHIPKWIGECNNLSFVEITVCKQGSEDLTILGGLPKLQCLILGLDFIPTEAVVIESEKFPELEKFSVDCPMPWLTFQTGAMQKLTYLQLKFCAIPASQPGVLSGICNLARLTEVVLCYNEHYANSPSVKRTVAAVKKQVAEHSNPIDLFINDTVDYNVQEVDEVAQNAVGTQSGTDARIKDDVQAVDEKNAATEIQKMVFLSIVEPRQLPEGNECTASARKYLASSQGAMQKLAYLQLNFCAVPASQPSVPSDIGNLQSLMEVALCYNVRYASSPSVSAAVEAVREQVANHLNQIDLFINGIQDCDVQAPDQETENWTGAQCGTGAETKDDVQAVDEKLVKAATQIQISDELYTCRRMQDDLLYTASLVGALA